MAPKRKKVSPKADPTTSDTDVKMTASNPSPSPPPPLPSPSPTGSGGSAMSTTPVPSAAAAGEPEPNETNTFDFIVVGGGTAACAVAGRLSEDPTRTVFLLERGKDETNNPDVKPKYYTLEDPPCPGPFLPVETFNIPDKNLALTVQKGMFLEYSPRAWGGGPAVSGSFWGRGDPTNYNEWAKGLNDPTWTYDALLPFFKITEHVFALDNTFPVSNERGKHGPVGAGALNTTAASNKPFLAAFCKTFHCTQINDSSTTAGQYGVSPMVRSLGLDPDKPVRNSSYVTYVVPYLSTRKNITTLGQATVTRILTDNSGPNGSLRARGICYLKDGVSQYAFARREIIIGAGTINSAKILLQSGIGPKADLESVGIPCVHNLPGVGRNMTEHTVVTFNQLINPLVLPNKVPRAESGANIGFLKSQDWPKQAGVIGVVENKIQTAVAGFASKVVSTVSNLIAHSKDGGGDNKKDSSAAAMTDVKTPKGAATAVGAAAAFAPNAASTPKPIPTGNSDPGFTPAPQDDPSKPLIDIELSYCLAGLSDVLPVKNMLIGFMADVRNRYRGTVKLQSKDPLVAPLISYQTINDNGTLTDGFNPFGPDYLKLIDGMKLVRKWLFDTDLCIDSPINNPNAKGWDDVKWLEWVASLISGLYHWAGTCKMGLATDPAAVVDTQLRVHGIAGLRIADCSVMPIVVSTHPSASATMIGERCAYFIQGWSKYADPTLNPGNGSGAGYSSASAAAAASTLSPAKAKSVGK